MKKQHIRWIFAYICIDQITKFIANMALDLNEEVYILGDVLFFSDAQNYGTAFQIVEGHGLTVFFTLLLSLILLFSFYHHTKESERLTLNGILLMMGGICGNLLDRIFLRYIRDFIGISLFDTKVVLNLADLFLWGGLICIVIAEVHEYRQKMIQKQAAQTKQDTDKEGNAKADGLDQVVTDADATPAKEEIICDISENLEQVGLETTSEDRNKETNHSE